MFLFDLGFFHMLKPAMTNAASQNDSPKTLTEALEIAFNVLGCHNVSYRYSRKMVDGKNSVSISMHSLNDDAAKEFVENEECLKWDAEGLQKALETNSPSYTMLISRQQFELMKEHHLLDEIDNTWRSWSQPN